MKFNFYLLSSALALSLAVDPEPALAGPPPPGSYQATCQIYQVNDKDMELLAACKAKDGKTKLNNHWVYKYCVGDIANINGYLSCPKDTAKMQADALAANQEAAKKEAEAAKNAVAKQNMAKIKAKAELVEAAKPAFNSAGTVALGRPAKLTDPVYWYDGMMASNGAEWNAADGITFAEAFRYLKHELGQPKNSALRAEVVNRAFQEVHGRPSTAVEQATWDPKLLAQQAWYTPMVTAERQALAANPALRAQMVARTVKQAFGREAGTPDQRIWGAGDATSGQIKVQMRNWLYSPDGASELVATVKRALGIKGRVADEAGIKAAVAQYSATKSLYFEMVN